MIEIIGATLILIVGIISFFSPTKRIVWISDVVVNFLVLGFLIFHMPISVSISLFALLTIFQIAYFATIEKEKKIARVKGKNLYLKLGVWLIATSLVAGMSYLHINSGTKSFLVEIGKVEKYNLLIGLFLFIMFLKRGTRWNSQH
ncbi:MAG: hypothetical protein KC478_02500 [Bacteriovoracaceae bacterium]|nr:hypothetical protein [Bacteriovoracaceae bacterium]